MDNKPLSPQLLDQIKEEDEKLEQTHEEFKDSEL